MKIKSLHLPALRPLLKKAAAKRKLRLIVPVAGGLTVLALVIILPMILSDDSKQSVDSEVYKERLQGQVTSEDGAPRDGRDPASQKQNSLASAASKPTGSGQRTTSPASGVVGNHDHHHEHHANHEQTGLSANGCYIDYGTPGEQCLPAHAAENGVLTCEGVRSVNDEKFKNGIKVNGNNDRFHLDTNHNGIACDPGD